MRNPSPVKLLALLPPVPLKGGAPEGGYDRRVPALSETEAATKLQSLMRGRWVRSQAPLRSLKQRRVKVDGVLAAAARETEKFEPWVLDLEIDSPRVNGVPVPLLEYEEQLLRLQLQLDGMESVGVAADVLRHLRRKGTRAVQAPLTRVDTCRADHFWTQSPNHSPVNTSR